MNINYHGNYNVPVNVTHGFKVWRCYYNYSYSGRKCTGILEPMEIEWDATKSCWLKLGTKKKVKNDYRAWYFEEREDCLKAFDEQLAGHANSMRGNIIMDMSAIGGIRKRLHNKNIQAFTDIKQELVKAIQEL